MTNIWKNEHQSMTHSVVVVKTGQQWLSLMRSVIMHLSNEYPLLLNVRKKAGSYQRLAMVNDKPPKCNDPTRL